jgi:hypothetical protein
MKHTHEQLEEMSDAELNAILHMAVLGSPWKEQADLSANKTHLCLHNPIGEPFFENVPDYCNNWGDIMPLTIENGIAVKKVPLRKEWVARSIDYSEIVFKCFFREDLPRAIACCLIMVLESKS